MVIQPQAEFEAKLQAAIAAEQKEDASQWPADSKVSPDGTCLAVKNDGSSSAPYTINALSLAPGTYYLIIDTWPTPDCIPDFDLTITESAVPEPSDNCSDPLKMDIPSLPYYDYGQTTCGHNDNYNATCLGSLWLRLWPAMVFYTTPLLNPTQSKVK